MARMPALLATFFSLLALLGAVVADAQTNLKDQIDRQVNAAVETSEIREDRDPRLIAAGAIKVLLQLLGTFFLMLMIIGGYWYLTAQGDEEQVSKGQKTIQGAVIGLLVIMISYSVVLFVGQRIGPAVIEGGRAPR